jgi:hypothetical protein
MTTTTTTAPTVRLVFPQSDLEWLSALIASPDASEWLFHRDADESWDLISVQPPFAPSAVFVIIPGETGGVLMCTAETPNVAYPSLREALLAIGPHGEDWSRIPG